MANHEQQTGTAATLDDATEGALGTPPGPPATADEADGGPDYGLFVLLAVVALLVTIQNIWLRRRAQRESGEPSERS